MGFIRQRFERFLAGPPSDPLCVSNRTIGQRVGLALLIAVPCLLLAAVAAVLLVGPRKGPTREERTLTRAEIAERMLPDLKATVPETRRDVEVIEAHVERPGARAISGKVKNNTDHVASADFTLQVADGQGSVLGAVSGHVENLKPNSISTFRIPIDYQTAYTALVRDVQVR